jgi:hypothetical protein
VPLNVFSGRGASDRILLRSLAKAARNASSITVRSEHRRSCEIFFAFCKSESSIEIVVLMHQTISRLHHDAKPLRHRSQITNRFGGTDTMRRVELEGVGS